MDQDTQIASLIVLVLLLVGLVASVFTPEEAAPTEPPVVETTIVAPPVR